jgi:hypothetical protein
MTTIKHHWLHKYYSRARPECVCDGNQGDDETIIWARSWNHFIANAAKGATATNLNDFNVSNYILTLR